MTIRCPECDKYIANEEDHAKLRTGEGEHLCWRAWLGDVCAARGKPAGIAVTIGMLENEIRSLKIERDEVRAAALRLLDILENKLGWWDWKGDEENVDAAAIVKGGKR